MVHSLYLYAVQIPKDIKYFWTKVKNICYAFSREKKAIFSGEIPHDTHNFSNLKTYQNALESFFVEFSGSNQNPTLTSSKVG